MSSLLVELTEQILAYAAALAETLATLRYLFMSKLFIVWGAFVEQIS